MNHNKWFILPLIALVVLFLASAFSFVSTSAQGQAEENSTVASVLTDDGDDDCEPGDGDDDDGDDDCEPGDGDDDDGDDDECPPTPEPTQVEPTPTQVEPTPTQVEPTPTQVEPTPSQVEPTPSPTFTPTPTATAEPAEGFQAPASGGEPQVTFPSWVGHLILIGGGLSALVFWAREKRRAK